jgi:hypothetical protein
MHTTTMPDSNERSGKLQLEDKRNAPGSKPMDMIRPSDLPAAALPFSGFQCPEGSRRLQPQYFKYFSSVQTRYFRITHEW